MNHIPCVFKSILFLKHSLQMQMTHNMLNSVKHVKEAMIYLYTTDNHGQHQLRHKHKLISMDSIWLRQNCYVRFYFSCSLPVALDVSYLLLWQICFARCIFMLIMIRSRP